jgi:hypothetical protein
VDPGAINASPLTKGSLANSEGTSGREGCDGCEGGGDEDGGMLPEEGSAGKETYTWVEEEGGDMPLGKEGREEGRAAEGATSPSSASAC